MIEQPLCVWNYKTKDKQVLKGHQFGVSHVAWISDEELVSVSYDWTTRIWNVPK